jgi:hypothetical protein
MKMKIFSLIIIAILAISCVGCISAYTPKSDVFANLTTTFHNLDDEPLTIYTVNSSCGSSKIIQTLIIEPQSIGILPLNISAPYFYATTPSFFTSLKVLSNYKWTGNKPEDLPPGYYEYIYYYYSDIVYINDNLLFTEPITIPGSEFTEQNGT